MIPKFIIEKAIEGGYDIPKVGSVMISPASRFGLVTAQKMLEAYIALDPLFWQSLGKELRWKKFRCECGKEYDAHGLIVCSDCNKVGAHYSWHATALRFFNEILTSGDTEAFWQSISDKK